MKCILIETKEKRRLITLEKNLIKLKEFIKIFNLKVSKVESNERVLDLKQLISIFCGNPIKRKRKRFKK